MPHSLKMWNEVGGNIKTFPTVGHNYNYPSHVHYRMCLPNNKNVTFADVNDFLHNDSYNCAVSFSFYLLCTHKIIILLWSPC